MPPQRPAVHVRPMRQQDIAAADRIVRVAFGTFLNAPHPETFFGDKDYIATRWQAHPGQALVAEVDGAVVGSNLFTHWGSFAFFGPLTVAPPFWDKGVAQALLAPTVAAFERKGARAAGLFTFAHSPKHLALYQKFGFWPQALTALMSQPLRAPTAEPRLFSGLAASARAAALAAGRALSDELFPGLDISGEITAIAAQKLGDTVLLGGTAGEPLEGFAACHAGAGTEAGGNVLYIKAACVRGGEGAAARLDQLLDGCHALAAGLGLDRAAGRLECGVNTARLGIYQHLLARGFRINMAGIAMLRGAPAFNRPEVWWLDDWR